MRGIKRWTGFQVLLSVNQACAGCIKYRKETEGVRMKRLIGYSLFCMAAGIFIGLIVADIFWCILLSLLFLLIGYNLFCC